MATIARLVTVIEAQMQGFEKATATFEKTSKQIETSVSGVNRVVSTMGTMIAGAFTVSAVVGFAKEVASFASNMNDLSAQTGITTQRLQALNYVGAAAGVTVEDMATGVAQLAKRLIGGDDGAANAIQKLGLNTQALINLGPDQAFIEIAEAVARIPNPMERSATMIELFGRNGAKFLRLANDELKELVKNAERFAIPQETLDAADKFDDTLAQMAIRAKAIAATLTGEIFKAFSTVDMGDNGGAFKGAATFAKQAAEAQAEANQTFNETVSVMKTAPPLLQTYGSSLESLVGKLQKQKEAQEAVAKATAELHRQYAALMSDVRNEEGIAKMNADLALMNATTSEATKKQLELAASWQVGLVNQTDLTESLIVGAHAIESQNAAIGGNVDQMVEAHNQSVAWRTAMSDLAENFLTFSQIAGDSMGKVLRQIGAAIAGIQLAESSVNSLRSGLSNLGNGNILKGLAGIVGGIGGIVSAASAAVQVVQSLWQGLKSLFGGGEEGTQVNPARDSFFQQFTDRYGLSPFDSMAAAFGDAGIGGDVAEGMIRNLYDADTMQRFASAAEAIVSSLRGGGLDWVRFHSGGMVPGSGEVKAILQGGERVQSRQEVADFGRLARALQDMPGLVARRVADEMVKAPRLRTV